MKPSILIIGAGATGLMAARALSEHFDVTVLEALNRTGGRIHSIRLKDTRIDAGAEFVHGDLPITKTLLEEAGLHLEKIEGRMFSVTHCEWIEQDEGIEGWDEIMDRMKNLSSDLTLDAFLEMYFSDPKYEDLRRHTREYAAGFDLADPTRVSSMALYREWSDQPDTQFRIREGYGPLIDHLAKACEENGCRILLNKKIKQVGWQKNKVTATTAEGEIFTGDKVIITIPAGVLQQSDSSASIRFNPAITNYNRAWQNIGYGTVLKIVLVFETSFWEQQHKNTGFIFSEEVIPTWWTQPGHILTGWLGGPAAVQWDDRDETYILEQAMHSLASIFRMEANELIAMLKAHHVARWHAAETACGAYSYETPISGLARELLKTPIENTLYFAGEALYEGAHPGTVEAAFASGKEVAGQIINKTS